MKKTKPPIAILTIVLVIGLLFGGTGCTPTVAGELATLSGAYIGDIVTSVVTGGLFQFLGIEADEADDADGLHEHEH